MTSKRTKPTLILKVGQKNIKEYTHSRIIQKLKAGTLSLDTLVHNPDGLWRSVSETPGFRTLCARLAGGPKGEAEKTQGHAADHSLAEFVLPPFLPPVAPDSPHRSESLPRDEERSLSHTNAPSGPEFEMELEDEDSIGEEELNRDESKELDESDDSGEVVSTASDSETAFNILDSAPAVSQPQVFSPRDSSDSANPFASKQYFRVKPKGNGPISPVDLEEDVDAAAVWKKRGLIAILSLWAILLIYWLNPFSGNGPPEVKENLEGPALLANIREEKEKLASGGFGGVTEKDKKAFEKFKKEMYGKLYDDFGKK